MVVYSKRIIISNIINAIISTTEMNFQQTFVSFLEVICKYNNLSFEKVQPANGDAKNDGWIPEKKIYFGMYSPNDPNISQIRSINKKLYDDLDGLCEHVYVKGEWGKEINKFYLIVNTHDKDFPADPERLIEKTIKKIKEKYKKEFVVEVVIAKDIKHFLLDSDIALIEKISNYLDVYNIEQEFSIPEIVNFIDEYMNYLATQKIEIPKTDYSRIKVEDKIKLNNLDERHDRILNLIAASDKIDKYLKFVNSEGMDMSNYENLKNFIIQKYTNLSINNSGSELYDKLLDELIYDSMMDSRAVILEAIVVNIFIKCDIFQKE